MSCVDQDLVEMIVKDVISDFLNDGRLQAGLNNCTGTSLPRGRRIPTCDAIEDMVEEAIESGAATLAFPAEAPEIKTGECAIPTQRVGGSDVMLGTPAGWVRVGKYVIPYYAVRD